MTVPWLRSCDDDKGSLSHGEILRRIAEVAIPSYPMQLVSRIQNLVTLSFIGRYGHVDELAAFGLAAMITNVTGMSWLWGMSGAIATTSSQDWGARAYRKVGVQLQRGVWILLCLADIPLMTAWFFSEDLLLAAGMSETVSRLVGLYSRIRIPGLFFQTFGMAFNRTLMAIGNAHITLIMGVASAVVNVALSSWLIPHYGFVGAAITACLGDGFLSFGTILLACRDHHMRRCLTRPTWEAFQHWGDFMSLALPSMVLTGVEWWTWDLQSLLAGYVSPLAQATQAVAPMLTDLQYATGQAIGSGATTSVGNLLGEGRPGAARTAMYLTILVTFLLSLGQAALFYFFRRPLAGLFTADEEVAESITTLLPLTLFFSFMDGHQCALTGVLIGAGKQHIAAPVIFLCYWVVGVPLGAALAFGKISAPLGLVGLWVGMAVAVCLHFVSFAFIAAYIDWRGTSAEIQQRLEPEASAALLLQ